MCLNNYSTFFLPVDRCNDGTPGSLDCLLSGVENLFHAMDDLSYQLDLSDSFDSGNGSDEGEDTEIESSLERKDEISFRMCRVCSSLVCRVR